MEALGYRSQSQFIRDCTLRDDISSLKLIRDIHKKICEEDSNAGKTCV